VWYGPRVGASVIGRIVAVSLLVLATTAAPAPAARTLKLRFPRTTIPAGGNVENCLFLRVPLRKPFDVGGIDIRHRGVGGAFAVRHFLVYLYTGDHLADFAAQAGTVVSSRGCLDLGPADREARQLIASGAAIRSRGGPPAGTALRLVPAASKAGGRADAVGILLDSELVNGGTTSRRASSVIVLHAAKRSQVKRLLQPILATTAEDALLIPPGTVRSTEASTADWNAAHPGATPLRDAWSPPGDACVVRVTGHFHRRTRFFGADLLDATGTIVPAPGGLANPFESGRTHLFGAPDFSDPGEHVFTPPQLVHAGEAIHWACWVDNGVVTVQRLGCEESAGVTPGSARADGGTPADPCHTTGPDLAECPVGASRTGQCVPANVVAGTSVDDEVCQLAGFWYEAAPGGSCDLGALPPLAAADH